MALKLKILRDVIAGGKVHAKDAVIEVGKALSKEIAKRLIEDEHAQEHDEESAPAKPQWELQGGPDYKPQRDDKGLRLDGPTLEQYVKAGYKAENYPPQGYAAKK